MSAGILLIDDEDIFREDMAALLRQEGYACETAASGEEAHRLKVMIRDSGVGMNETVRTRLFEPFFTTKQEGTGLGLSICYSLVHAHGGSINVASEPGTGSCFTVDLPVTAAADIRRLV